MGRRPFIKVGLPGKGGLLMGAAFARAIRRVATLGRSEPGWVRVLFLCLFVLGSVRFCTQTRSGGVPMVRIGSDARYYWAYLTSLALDHDLDFRNQYANPRSGNYFRYQSTETGHYANPFTLGPAVLWMPFFAIGHFISLVAEPADAADGTSDLTQIITLYGSFLYMFLAILLAYGVTRRRYGPGAAAAGALVAALAGPLYQYTLHQPGYAHATSAFSVVLLLALWDRGRGTERSWPSWIGLGAAVGLAALQRPQNVLYALPVVCEGGYRIYQAVRRSGLGAGALAALRPLGGGLVALAVFSPQMIAWKIIYGSFVTVPQGHEYMRWGESLWAHTLFSSRNGLFPYAPLWAAGLLGLVWVFRRDRALALWLGATFFLAAFVSGATSDWYGGGAFGGRRFDGLLLHVSLGIGALVDGLLRSVERRPRATAGGAVAAVIALAIWFNATLADQYQRGRLARSGAKDTLAMYDAALMDMGRKVFRFGNPLSWPGAWAFWWRTGAPPSRYDEVVGAFFLRDNSSERYRPLPRKLRDALRFGARGHARFLVWGFGRIRSGHSGPHGRPVAVRPALGPKARFLLPFNCLGPVGVHLVGTARAVTRLRVLWNGRLVAEGRLHEEQPIDMGFVVPRDRIRRGVNVVDLVHQGVRDGQVAATYERVDLRSLGQ